MTARVTSQINIQNNIRNLQRHQVTLSTLQNQISSGIKLHKPSDDPLGMRQQLLQQDRIARLESHQRSIQQSKLQLEQAGAQLQVANDLFTRAQQIGLQAVQATEPNDRRALAAELDGILVELKRVANDISSDGAIFGGAAPDRQPFQISGDGSVSYQGASIPTRLVLGDSQGQDALIPGNQIFDTPGRGATLIEGATGVATGSGTDTATGIRELQFRHTITTITGGSGLQSSVSSGAVDTILGSHQIVINDTSGTGAFGTISFLDGSEVNYSSADTNLKVTGPGGEVVYVDTTAITPGFTGTITVQGDGELSVDGGLTYSQIAFSANQLVVDSRDGSTVNLNTSAVRRSGSDRVEFQQTADAFETLKLLKDDLLAADQLPSSVSTPRLQRRLDDIQRIQDHLLSQIGDNSVRQENLDHLRAIFEDQTSQTKINLSDHSATDIPDAVIRLQETQNLYQYTLSSLSRLYDTSLLNYLR